MSLAIPWAPPLGWWTIILLFGIAYRFPAEPAQPRRDPMLAAWPMTVVAIGHVRKKTLKKCVLSQIFG